MKISRNNTNVPPADYGHKAEIFDFVRIGWFVCHMCRALNGSFKAAHKAYTPIRPRGGRGLAVRRMAHIISGCLDNFNHCDPIDGGSL